MSFIEITGWPLWAVSLAFILSAITIAIAGTYLTRMADRLADMTGLGEAIFGAVFLGASTSLSGSVTSVAAAYQGYAELAVSNGIGGIAIQTVFLVVADISYRQANLEHAAASLENLVWAALLMILLSLPLLAAFTPDYSIWSVHPVSILMIGAYLFGLRLVRQTRETPLWQARTTEATRSDDPQEEENYGSVQARVWFYFAGLVLILGAAGFMIAQTGVSLVERTGLSETVVGFFMTSIATSLPELVTSLAAVRQGALTLAVGGIIGGNTFDVLFLSFSDVGYRAGSIYHAINEQQLFIIALAILMTGILLLGLLRREKRGIASIGFESFLVLIVYVAAFSILI